jgi:hypothetical protein
VASLKLKSLGENACWLEMLGHASRKAAILRKLRTSNTRILVTLEKKAMIGCTIWEKAVKA